MFFNFSIDDTERLLARLNKNKTVGRGLCQAAVCGNLSLVNKILTSKDCNFGVLGFQNESGKTALYLAVEIGHYDCVLAILKSPYFTGDLLSTTYTINNIYSRTTDKKNVLDVANECKNADVKALISNCHKLNVYISGHHHNQPKFRTSILFFNFGFDNTTKMYAAKLAKRIYLGDATVTPDECRQYYSACSQGNLRKICQESGILEKMNVIMSRRPEPK